MSFVWNEFLIKPILNLMLFLYNALPISDLGIVIIIVTIIIRFLILPLSLKASRAQRRLKKLAPELESLKEKYKGDQQSLAKAQMDFYKQNGVSPFSSCLPLLIQLPILFALYGVLRQGLTEINPNLVYSFISLPEEINHFFLGILDLSKSEKVVLPILAGVTQYILGVMTTPISKSKTPSPEQAINKQMVYMMPAMSVFIALTVPSGLVVYWVTTTVFSIAQQVFVGLEKSKEVTIKVKKDGNKEEIVIAPEEEKESHEKDDGSSNKANN